MSNLFVSVLKEICTETVRATASHPLTKDPVERYNRTMTAQLRHYVTDDPCRRDELLKTYKRYVAHRTLHIESEEDEGGSDSRLPYGTRH